MGNVIFVENADESTKVQTALFSVGIRWASVGKEIFRPESHFLTIENGELTYCDNFKWIVKYAYALCLVPLNAIDVITDPLIVDGAKKQTMHTINGKEFSESTIAAALKEYTGKI